MRKVLRRIWYVLRRRRAHDDLAEELAFHRDMAERAFRAGGAGSDDAAVAARRALGSTALAHDQVHDVWVAPWLQGFGHDVRLAVRTLLATPVVSIVAVLSLALGIGANTAIFSVIDGLLLRTLPVRDPARLVLLTDDAEGENPYWSYQVWSEIDRRTPLFDGTLAWSDARLNLAQGGETRYVNGVWVTGSFFDLLGVTPLLGRTLSASDDVPGGGSSGPVAVISYDFWQRHYGGSRTAIGAPLLIEGVPFTVIGVTPPDFFGVDVGRAFDVAAPIRARDVLPGSKTGRGAAGPLVRIIARLAQGATITSATQALRGVQPQIREATLPQGWPKVFLDRYLTNPFTLKPAAMGASLLRNRFSRPLVAIMVIVALVLLVASANLANLALARAAARRRELGVRLALGASRMRLVRQLLTESVVLAGTGAVLGLLVASWTARLLVQQLSTTVRSPGAAAMTGRVFVDVSIDGRVLAFTMALSVITVVVFGVVPALRASRVVPLDALAGPRPGERRRGTGPTDMFVVAQVAVSLIVVVAAGLFTRTLTALETRHLGFDREEILVVTVDAEHVVDPARRQNLYTSVVDAVRQVPGVSDAALSVVPPVSTGAIPGQPIRAISGEAPLPPRGAFSAVNLISPGWFRTLGIPLAAGRDVSRDDRLETPPVVIVNQTFARTLLHGANPVGRTLTLHMPGPPPPPIEIVGVVSDTVFGGMRSRIEPTIFLPIAQLGPSWSPFLVPIDLSVRSIGRHRPDVLARSVGDAIAGVNRDLALTFHPLTDYVNDSLVQERLIARVSGSFAVLTLLLAALGLYGVLAYAVVGRRTEIGIRIALGAGRNSIIRLVLGRVFVPVALGVVIGAVVSLWASSFVASLLYEVRPRDPATFGGAVVILAGVAFVAGWLPARRAARIDPMRILRAD